MKDIFVVDAINKDHLECLTDHGFVDALDILEGIWNEEEHLKLSFLFPKQMVFTILIY